jgi:pimeloyl-ACP methyl ester carboxylesterase
VAHRVLAVGGMPRHATLALIALLLLPVLAHADPPASRAKGAATSTSKPSIVLVHGAWADGSSWDKVVPLLEAKGYNVIAVHLPMTSVSDDVAATQRAIARAPGDVVLAGHSYGGFVISEAGNDPKVKKLVYVDAFELDDGESVGALFKGNPPAWSKTLQPDSGGFLWMPLDTVKKDFAQDLPAAEQTLVAVKQGPFTAKAFDEVMKNPAWKTKPSWYVRGTADRIIDPAAQEQWAKRAHSKLTSIDAGHVSMLSKPRQVANVILDAANAPTTTASK